MCDHRRRPDRTDDRLRSTTGRSRPQLALSADEGFGNVIGYGLVGSARRSRDATWKDNPAVANLVQPLAPRREPIDRAQDAAA